MEEGDAALYEAPFQHIREHVHPMRQRNRREAYRLNWWRHVEPRPRHVEALDGLSRYIATPRVSKHRLFVWFDIRICPDSALIAIAPRGRRPRSASCTAGSTRLGRYAWALGLARATIRATRPRTTFETFPFPDGLSPDIPASDYKAGPRARAIASAARRLVELRDRWLNPPGVGRMGRGTRPRLSPRPIPRDK